MLEEKDLQAIAQLMDQKLAQQKQEILDEATHRMQVLLDTEVTTKFNLLAENQEEILNRLSSPEDAELLESRVDTLELAVRKHSREIAELQKAQ